jgi:hypothetical protein
LKLEKMTHEVEEIAVDGLMLFGAGLLEGCAEKVIANHRFLGVAVKMTEAYLNSTVYSLAAAETEMERDKDRLAIAEQRYSDWSSPSGTRKQVLDPNDILSGQRELGQWMANATQSYLPVNRTLSNWDGAVRWLAIAKDGAAVKETLLTYGSHKFGRVS